MLRLKDLVGSTGCRDVITNLTHLVCPASTTKKKGRKLVIATYSYAASFATLATRLLQLFLRWLGFP